MKTNHDIFLSSHFWDILKAPDGQYGNDDIREEQMKIIDILRNSQNKLFIDIANFKSLISSYTTKSNVNIPFEIFIAFKIWKSRLVLPSIGNSLINAINNSNKAGIVFLKNNDSLINNPESLLNKYIYTGKNLAQSTFSKNDIQDIEVSPDMNELNDFIKQTRNIFIIDKYIFNDSIARDRVLKMPNIITFLNTFINNQPPGIRINLMASSREAENDAHFDQKLEAFKDFASHNLAIVTIVLFHHTHNLPLTYEKSERFILTDYLFIKNSHPFDRNNIAHVAFMPNKPKTQSIANRILENFIILSDMATQNGKMTNFYYSPDRNIQKFVFNGVPFKRNC